MVSIEKLLASYQQADPKAFDALYESLCPILYRIAMTHLRKDEDAQDAVQMAFLKIHRHILKYDPTKPAMAWIFTIIRHAIVDVARKRGNLALSTHAVDSREVPASQELRLEIEQLLESLPEEDRKLLMSRLLEDLSFDELAQREGVRAPTLRKRFSRLMDSLRNLA